MLRVRQQAAVPKEEETAATRALFEMNCPQAPTAPPGENTVARPDSDWRGMRRGPEGDAKCLELTRERVRGQER